MRSLKDFFCQNLECVDWGKRDAGNLRQHGWSSKRQQIRLLYCRSCGSYFSERKGTALEDSRLPQQKAESVLEHIQEGCGVRQSARLVKVNKNTVSRLTLKAGEHAYNLHDELVAFSPADPRDSV